MVHVLRKRYLLPGQGWLIGIVVSLLLSNWLSYPSFVQATSSSSAQYLATTVHRPESRVDGLPARILVDWSGIELTNVHRWDFTTASDRDGDFVVKSEVA